MPVYRVFVDGKDTGDYVTASSPQDAYADVAASLPLTYRTAVRLEEVASGLPVSEQELWLPDPGERE